MSAPPPIRPAPQPLTPLQQGMLFSWLRDPAAGLDLEQLVCTLQEAPDPSRLRSAWEAVIAAHPVLRTVFDTAAAEPVQFTLPSVSVPWREEDWSADSAGLQQEKLARFLDADRRLGFDLAIAPLLRFTFLRLGPLDCRLIWTFHHILLDGRAITRLVREAFDRYDGRPVSPPSADPASHSRWLHEKDHAPSAVFWTSLLAGVSGPTPLVIDGLPGTDPTRCQDECDHRLCPALTDQLRRFAGGAGVTLNTLVQGAWAILLGRYAGEEQVVFGATRACRHTPVAASQEMAGLLINTLPVRIDLPGTASLIPWLLDLRRLWVGMRPHEHTPLSFIRRLCGMPADQVPFQHLLVFENDDYTGTLRHGAGPGWQNRTFHLRELTSVPLTLAVYGGEALRLHCAFQPARFDKDSIARLLGHMAELLTRIASAAPGTLLRDLHPLTAAERRLLVHDCQPADPGFSSDTTLHGWFSQTAARFPDKTALTAGETRWSYAELDRRSDLVARTLLDRGVQPGDIVGLCMDRKAPLVAALLGILKTGAAYLPIDLAYPPERLAFMLEDADAAVILTEKPLASKIPPNPAQTVFLEDIDFSPASPAAYPSPPTTHSPDSLAYIIYTSGSTGLPKGCRITHRNVVRLMRATEPWFHFGESDVWTLFHSTAFDFSVWELWGALLYGGRLVVVPWLTTRSPDEFFRLLCEERVTILNQTPSAFRQLIHAEPLARASRPGLPDISLRFVIFGGEALEMQSLRPWFERHGDTAPQLVNMYGITETTVHVTYRPLSARDLDRGSLIGVPIPDLQLHILDPVTLQPVPIGIPGEMHVGGAGLAPGYLHRPALTAERFIPNHLTGHGRLYKSGDLARRIPGIPGTGFAPVAPGADTLPPRPPQSQTPSFDIEYLGRIDHQVKIRGFRIELGEIESLLTSHSAVLESAVLAREDRPGDKRLCAYLVTDSSVPPPSPAALRALLLTRVPDYMVPAAFVYLPVFPITPNGKLDRKALPAPAAGNSASRTFLPPSTPAETALAAIWAAVLRLDRVSASDNFFEIGGDSILSIQVIARARESGLALTPRQLFENPTVAALAAAARPLAAPAAVSTDLTALFPLTPIQRWFFDQNLTDSHHWNQSFLFDLKQPLAPGSVRAALSGVVALHPALRLRFRQKNGAWIPSIAPEETADLLTVSSPGEDAAALSATARTSLNYQSGPLLHAVLFAPGANHPARLLLTIHHLAVDGVSWRIVLEDLEALLAGRPAAPPTAPWPEWARRVAAWPSSPGSAASRSHWTALTPLPPAPVTLESDTFTRTVRLDPDTTTALLQRAPAAYRTRINDILLTALAIARGGESLRLNLEGHGREEILSGGLPLDRTVGWFTSIFPVLLTLPDPSPAAALPSIKEQLRRIPDHGAGFLPLAAAAGPVGEPADCVFNYLGQLDSLTAGSSLFTFSAGATGPWHSPRATRAHSTEINAMVLHGSLEVAFTSAPPAHTPESLTTLSGAFLTALRALIDHCLTVTAPRFTPSDFPLSGLDQSALDLLTAQAPSFTDVCRLSPMQELFHAAALTKPGSGFDQWHCRIRGPLDPSALQETWSRVTARHTILRSTFHSAGLSHAVMAVHENGTPEFTRLTAEGPDPVTRLLASDASRLNDLTRPLCGRFTLLQLAPDDHFLLWSLPDLQLDGWSWPLVFAEAALVYCALTSGQTPALPGPLPYQNYLAWLNRQDPAASDPFWQSSLAGLTEPTAVPVDSVPGPRSPRRTAESRLILPSAAADSLTAAARALGVTPGVFAQAAWAALLAHTAGHPDVVHGSAFSGRPADLPGAERIVGPFVNNLPVRSRVDPSLPVAALLRKVHATLADLAAHQSTPLPRIQDQSAIPWRHRLFDSLLVFQNYQIDPALRQLGPDTWLTGFGGPIHTNFPLTLVITPSSADPFPDAAVPPGAWELLLVYREAACSPARADAILTSFSSLLQSFAASPGNPLSEHLAALPLPAGCSPAPAPPAPLSHTRVPPRTPLETRLCTIWQKAFGLTEIGTTVNFFDLGGHSLLMLRVHSAICQDLGRSLPVVTLFQFPTIAALAGFLDPSSPAATAPHAVSAPSAITDRAAAARAAARRMAAARR